MKKNWNNILIKTFLYIVDVVLKCLGMDWELHRPFLQKATVLSNLLKTAGDPKMQKYYRNPASETLDTYIKKNNVYSNEYKDISNRYIISVNTNIVKLNDIK